MSNDDDLEEQDDENRVYCWDYAYFDADNYDDEYDRYEDMYLDTGYDPYEVFGDESTKTLVDRVLERGYRLKHRIERIWLNFKNRNNKLPDDDIPF